MFSNTSGIRNVGIGNNALDGNVSGSYNLALGFDAGYDQTIGNDNIYLNNVGVAGYFSMRCSGSGGNSQRRVRNSATCSGRW